jgi:hypothetical protein
MTVKERISVYIKYKGMNNAQFEKACGLSNGYVANMRKGIGTDKLNNVLTAFPDLNRDWLLYGEGEMIRLSLTQNASGSENFTQTGNVTVHAGTDEALAKVLDELAAQRRMNEKSQEQIDRLISIIEKQ